VCIFGISEGNIPIIALRQCDFCTQKSPAGASPRPTVLFGNSSVNWNLMMW